MQRRNFLKCLGVGSAILNIPGVLGALDYNKTKGTVRFVKSICEMCSTRCHIDVRVDKNNKIFIQGNILSKTNEGKICARGGSGVNQLLDPKRLINPIMRVGERGEGRWKEVSWDEAYAYIAQKLQYIKEMYGAHTVAFAAKSSPDSIFLNQFAYAYGSPNIFDHGSTCPSGYTVALSSVYGSSNLGRDYENCKFLLNFGHNVYEGIVINYALGITKAIENGCKVVSLDPRFSILSSKASEWIPIRPASDVAFMLGFIYTLIFEELYDKKFVEKYTIGFERLKESIKEYTPEKMAKECDVDAEKIKSLARECAMCAPHCIIDYGHRATFTPEEIEFRRSLAIANALLGNLECKGGLYFPKNPIMFNKIAQEEIAPIFKNSVLPKLPIPKYPRIDGVGLQDNEFEKIPRNRGIYSKIFETILTKKPYELHGLFISRSNPVITVNDANSVINALKRLDLFVCVDIYVSDSAQYADIILPESTYLEKDERILADNTKTPGYQVRQKVVEVIGNTKASHEIYKELAQVMGFGHNFPYKDIEDFRMQQAFEYPKEFYELKSKGVVNYGLELFARDKKSITRFINQYPKSKDFLDKDGEFSIILKCKTPSGKIELFDEKLERICNRGGLKYNSPRLKKDSEFYFIQGKVAIHTNGHTANVPWLSKLMNNNAVWINKNIADKLGLRKGDKIKIKSEVGEQVSEVLPTVGIREDTLFAYFGFGRISKENSISYKKGISASHLLKNTISPITGNNVHTIGVSIEKLEV
ncbi:thiosulfate reductase PhsA [Campylobacter subantarcticus]|uniref:Putative thiosulfate/polysulfide reductase, molybdenum-binding subunit n=1 Tax=Campylobacter subantarcticus LMG 24374 TaxID=1388751 RepID=A0A0A8HBV7_9BACT|nr:thiosulfate reductase PhsA [Campylobacter subantarcticus]AJC91155.1 putative thiosulfate/polysulfide reductase, molybdenum-binding subunit [Campylobacter subantarcticus LMG 24374]EAJ1261649.1 polysulfide/thiosulfate reductase, subunit A [Campylobacter lari]